MTKAVDTLKKHKLKVTPGRLELLSLLQNNKNAVSQSVIQNEFKEMDRVTLYRILGAFQEKGIIHKITDENGLSHFAVCKDECSSHGHKHHHIHFECDNCNTIFCVDTPELELGHLSNYTVRELDIKAKGICDSCK